MKLLFIIFFLFVVDIYFYTGTISTITKFFNNPIIYKLVYWFLSIAVYVVIIYISITYTRTTPSIRLNNNVIFTSLIGVLFISKLIGSIPLLFDGFKTFLSISKPTKEEFEILPHLVLTSSTSYDPTLQKRCYTRRVFKAVDVTFEEWRARLGYPTLAVTKKTIAATTQMVKTLEAETREYMRDHFKSRVHCLCPKRLNDTL